MAESKKIYLPTISGAPTRGGRQLLALFPKNSEIDDFVNDEVSLDNQTDNKTGLIHRTLSEPLSIRLPDEESRHALKVLRLKDGEILRIVDSTLNLIGQGVLKIKNHQAFVEVCIIAKLIKNYPDIIIGIPENKTAEACIEKLTEMGINSIVFFKAEFSQKTNLEFEKIEARLLKKRNVAVKQSYSLNSPAIKISQSLSQALEELKYLPNELITLFSPKDAEVIGDHEIKLENLVDFFTRTKRPQVAVVGPEGGFSMAELKKLISFNSRFLTLGSNTLRVETAASLAIAAIHALPN